MSYSDATLLIGEKERQSQGGEKRMMGMERGKEEVGRENRYLHLDKVSNAHFMINTGNCWEV